MAELTEQQQHLSSLLEQRAGLVAEINDLNSQAAAEGEVPEGEAPTPETEELPEPTTEG